MFEDLTTEQLRIVKGHYEFEREYTKNKLAEEVECKKRPNLISHGTEDRLACTLVEVAIKLKFVNDELDRRSVFIS